MGNSANLYIRFDIDAIEHKFNAFAYGGMCYKTVFKNVPAYLLQGCQVSMGDSAATLNGRENVCIIGLVAPEQQLQSIRDILSRNREFTSVSAANPLVLTDSGTEPLISDGVYTADGSQLRMWAKSAFDARQKELTAQAEAKAEQSYQTPPSQPQPQPQPTQIYQQPQPAPQPQPTQIYQQPYQPPQPSYQPPQYSEPQPYQQPSYQQPQQPSYQQPQYDEPAEETPRKRHGCLTAWVIFLMIVNAGVGVLCLAMKDEWRLSDSDVTIQVIGDIAVVVGCILVLNWKKIGFYLVLLAFVVLVTSALIAGAGIQSFSGTLGLIILWGLLSKKSKDTDVSAWNCMD